MCSNFSYLEISRRLSKSNQSLQTYPIPLDPKNDVLNPLFKMGKTFNRLVILNYKYTKLLLRRNKIKRPTLYSKRMIFRLGAEPFATEVYIKVNEDCESVRQPRIRSKNSVAKSILKVLHARSLKVEALDLEIRADTLTHQSVQDTVEASGIQTRCEFNLTTGTSSISVSGQVEHGRHTVQSVAHANHYTNKYSKRMIFRLGAKPFATGVYI